jgi:hypothetical protein
VGDPLSTIMGFAEQRDQGRQMCGYAVIRPCGSSGGILGNYKLADKPGSMPAAVSFEAGEIGGDQGIFPPGMGAFELRARGNPRFPFIFLPVRGNVTPFDPLRKNRRNRPPGGWPPESAIGTSRPRGQRFNFPPRFKITCAGIFERAAALLRRCLRSVTKHFLDPGPSFSRQGTPLVQAM